MPNPGSEGPPAYTLNACDREPIHVPGSIQPYGLLLIADRATRKVIAGAGDIEGRLTPAWMDRPMDSLVAQPIDHLLDGDVADIGVPLALVPGRAETFNAMLRITADRLMVELEPASEAPPTAAAALSELDIAGAQFERAADLVSLCQRAAPAFRRVTGFDRVMIYRFLDDGAGKVLAEARDPGLSSFLNHHFPASDIPRQARALYVRNRIRVIPDIDYDPAPIRPAEAAGTDLSDVGLRSVSPIHLQYMRNMGMAASASVSIVKDGLLWGLVACHHRTPRTLSYETRAICHTMAGELARYIRSKEEAETYRERIHVRGSEDQILSSIDPDASLDAVFGDKAGPLRELMAADGFAVLHGHTLITDGSCPPDASVRELAGWLQPRISSEPFFTQSLSGVHAAAESYRAEASGLLAVSIPSDTPTTLMWFRVEEPRIVEWAGNPHKDTAHDPAAILRPRDSFAAWTEIVQGTAPRWTRVQVEQASRMRRVLTDLRQSRRLRELNRELNASVAEKDGLLQQKDHLIREVNHRVQNSLQLVQSFLALQARSEKNEALTESLDEAQRRISAVALVHRRLYQADQLETVDLSRYLDDLLSEMRGAMGEDWSRGLALNLAPLLISADRAVHVGLILTELVINANKYAYDGASGPIEIGLEQYRNQFRLIVADSGKGRAQSGGRQGFGTRMIGAMVARLNGTIERLDNEPGLRVILTAPLED